VTCHAQYRLTAPFKAPHSEPGLSMLSAKRLSHDDATHQLWENSNSIQLPAAAHLRGLSKQPRALTRTVGTSPLKGTARGSLLAEQGPHNTRPEERPAAADPAVDVLHLQDAVGTAEARGPAVQKKQHHKLGSRRDFRAAACHHLSQAGMSRQQNSAYCLRPRCRKRQPAASLCCNAHARSCSCQAAADNATCTPAAVEG